MANYENGMDTQKLIMDSAGKLFSEKGYKGTTIAEIAQDSHVAKASILYHFKSKDGLYDKYGQQVLQKFFDRIAQRLDLERIACILHSYVFWYKFFNEESFRRYCIESLGKIAEPEDAARQTWQMLKSTYGIAQPYEQFLDENRLILDAAWTLEDYLIKRFAEHYSEYHYTEIAELDARLFARMFGIPENHIQARLDDAREILPSLDLEKMAEALNHSQI